MSSNAVDLNPIIIKEEFARRAHEGQSEVADPHIPVSCFVDPDCHIMLTNSGNLLAFFETEGIDPVCLSEEEIVEHTKILTEALNESDIRLALHQYWLKDKAFPTHEVKPYRDQLVRAIDAARNNELAETEFFSTRLIYCLEWRTSFSGSQTLVAALIPLVKKFLRSITKAEERAEAWEQLVEAMGGENAKIVAENRLLDEIADFKSAIDALVTRFERLNLGGDMDASLMDAVGATKLEFTRLVGTEAFRVLFRLWNWTPDTRQNMVYPTRPDRLNHWVAMDNLDMRDPAVVWSGDAALRLYSVRGFRDPVDWDVMRHVRAMPCEMAIHTRFARMSVDESSQFVSGRISKAHNWGGFVAHDPLRVKRIEDMKVALAESVRGKPFGRWSCQIALAGETRAEAVDLGKRFEAVCAGAGIIYRREEFSKDYAFYAMLPGNSLYEYCTRIVQTFMAVGVLMPYRQAEGRGVLPPRDCPFPEALCSINAFNPETKKAGLPVNWYMSVGNISHWAVLGKTGGGKSFLVNYIITNWGRYAGTEHEPVGLLRWIVDKGHSYKSLCELQGGAYINVADPATKAKMNPFDQSPASLRANTPMLISLLGLMMATASTTQVELTEDDAAALAQAIDGMARQLETQTDAVGSLVMLVGFLQGTPKLKARLEQWLPEGNLGHIFPGEKDGMMSNTFTVFNFEAQFVPESVMGAVFFYILSRISAMVESEEFKDYRKQMFVDEAAVFITPKDDWKSKAVTAKIRSFMREAWKTWRKKNGCLAIATQEAADLAIDDAFWNTFRGSVPTKIFIQQKGVGDELTSTKKGLGIPPHLVDEIQKLPLGAFLVDAGGMRRYLQLKPDAISYAIFTTDPKESSFRSWWLESRTFSEDYTSYDAFVEIGKHIQAAKRSGNAEHYYARIRRQAELGVEDAS